MADQQAHDRTPSTVPAEASFAERLTALEQKVEREQGNLTRQVAAARQEAADLGAKLVNLELATARKSRGRGVGAALRRRLWRARNVAAGRRLGAFLPNPLFDARWYYERYDDVRGRRMNAHRHYRSHGWREGLDPNPLFDTDWYLDRYPDVRDAGMNPLDHFLQFGAEEGRDPGPFFDTRWYLATYPDVQASGLNPLVHYLRHGQAEGRLSCPVERRVREVMSRVPRNRSTTPHGTADRRPTQRSLNRITLFYDGRPERSALENLAPAAERRGFEVVLTDELDAPAEIGVFCTHAPLPTNSRFSVVTLHDMGQEWWPDNQVGDNNHWRYSPWNEFDLGILPGPAWSDTWRRFSVRPSTRPRLGVFELGWPKADKAFADSDAFAQRVEGLRRSLGLANSPSVLYALSWEDADKQEAFISALSGLPVNLLIKPQPDHGWVQRRLTANTVMIDPKADIMECLALADVLVSDESSCIGEALLFQVGSVAVSDWGVPALSGLYPYREISTPGETPVPLEPLPARPSFPPDFVTKAPTAELRPAVERALVDSVAGQWRLEKLRNRWFSHIGHSSELIIDVIEAAVTGSPWPVEPLQPTPPEG